MLGQWLGLSESRDGDDDAKEVKALSKMDGTSVDQTGKTVIFQSEYDALPVRFICLYSITNTDDLGEIKHPEADGLSYLRGSAMHAAVSSP